MTDDLIGRAEAQTAIQFAARRYTVAHEAHGEGQVVWSDNLINVTDAMNVLRDLPSAQPETNCSEIPNNWIPCSERLPEIDKGVLVTDGELCWVCSVFESQDIEDGLYQWEDNYGHWHEFETWVAWMPLPEPYKGEQK